jgi:hypothetical protein
VSPGAARDEIIGRYGEVWKVRVAAPAERGRANDAVLDLLAEALGVSRRSVTLVAGATSRDKVIRVDGLTREDVDRLLAGRERKG